MAATLTSAGGLISLLDEDERELQYYGLVQLNEVMGKFWAEISDAISKIEVLYEDETFEHRKLAALVASKIYFHLGAFDDALSFALGAGELFDLTENSAFVQTVVNRAIDKYIELREWQKPIDDKLAAVFERMVERCFESKEFGQVIGIAIEARRLDLLERALTSGNTKQLLAYVQNECVDYIGSIHLQSRVQELLVKVYTQFENPNYEAICQNLAKLNNPSKTAEILTNLIQSGESGILSAYQIAFDLNANSSQDDAAKSEAEGVVAAVTKVQAILSGEESLKLNLESLDSRSSLAHNAVTLSNAFMHAGTTIDNFLRENLDSRPQLPLGVIHQGQTRNGFSLLEPYLPEDSVSSSPFSEGGAFYALGLINASHGSDRGQNVEILQHGASLGLGAAGLGSGSEDVFEALKIVLFADSAVSGEAAAIGMGLVMMGTGHEETIKTMLMYARETQHEKIIRALAVGMGLVMFGRQQEADSLIELLVEEEDPLLRLGAVQMTTMAYTGTGDNNAIRRLLHLAVSDVNDDVRRAAVTGLGFLLLRSPEQVPRMVQLLSESFNPHVRFGATLALGIACAGSGSKAAIAILEPMLKDSVDFVVQGACISLAFILIQQNEVYEPKVAEVRKRFTELIETKNIEPAARFGAAIAQGIINAGGRNVAIGLTSLDGQLSKSACAGMLLFTQFWYWFPLAHFLSLSFKPTALIGVNKDLRVPVLEATCTGRKSLFEYPPNIEQPVAQAPTKVATAVLSTTAKAQRHAKKVEVSAGEGSSSSAAGSGAPAAEGMDVDGAAAAAPKTPTKKTRRQGPESFAESLQGRMSGILVLRDTTPDEPENLIDSVISAGPDDEFMDADDGANTVQPPEPFEYPFDNDTA
ncbi:26S proteasome regulatory complex, non-ATPase subcomplex, Rpn2/Psmd1 subunit [Linderina pennispora]|uniref:26S proteasome regulatory subunit RPN2 n=1 Tax=Linderina pennispora TaxID=61395 RepID=A0A1Y1WAU8_9FUNG|nr:26S proteasome regulatory complex, non-ATPase subcomplex, Rpn2/Psmd1 subunit [Linderina pennispora]ORX70651.1 26S proteasome regulatory complex, non-ATPase subcomplex, Rpn2/Psmd1 subunit [Linderina pennispora]